MKAEVAVLAISGFASMALHAVDTAVAHTAHQLCSTAAASGSDALTAQTVDRRTYPAGLPTPAFWLDASDLSQWTVADNGNVTRVPSKSNARYLTTDSTGASWTGWWNPGDFLAPKLALDADLGAYCLDFGELGSGMAMIFDAEQPDGCTATNKLSTIGTAIVVMDTSRSGWFLGGGDENYLSWYRGNSYLGVDGASPWAPVFHDAVNNHKGAYYSYTRHDGAPFIASSVGYSGGWEVFSFAAKSAADCATLGATGLGMGDARRGSSPRKTSGGVKYAELIIYHDVLTEAQIKSVEDWLAYKWLNRAEPGINGRARTDTLLLVASADTSGRETTLMANAGETLSVGTLWGGHSKTGAAGQRDILKIAGAGTVMLDDATRYGGDVTLNGGTLKAPARRTIPAADDLPGGMALWFDPSDADYRTLASDAGTLHVTALANKAGETTYGGVMTLGLPSDASVSRFPLFAENATPTGLPLMDFGNLLMYKPCLYLSFLKDGKVYNPPLTTVITVVDSSRGGGWIMNSGFQGSTYPSVDRKKVNLLGGSVSAPWVNTNPALGGTNGVAYVNGERVVDPTATGYRAGQQIVCLQVPGTAPGNVGAWYGDFGGGIVLGEMMLWNRPLTETEIRDASAYLARKWLGRTLPGYARAVEDVADVQNLVVATPSTLNIAADETYRIGTLTLKAALTVSGGGRLVFERKILDVGGSIALQDGSVALAVEATEPPSAEAAAAAPALHFDFATTNGIVRFENDENGVAHLQQISDGANDIAAYCYYASSGGAVGDMPKYTPTMGFDATLGAQGLAYADFGAYRASGGPNIDAHALYLSRPIENARAAYVVVRYRTGSEAMPLFGICHEQYFAVSMVSPWHLQDWKRGTAGELFGSGAAGCLASSEIYTNGVACTRSTIPAADVWQLIEVHPTSGLHISAIGNGSNLERTGGIDVGEVLVYERPLSARERVATRNYLMKKWFNQQTPAALPAREPAELDVLDLTEDITLNIRGGCRIGQLLGGETLTKTGEGTLTLGDASSCSGTVDVVTGTLEMTGDASAAADRLTVNLAEGTLLDCSGNAQTLATLTGPGCVNGSVTVGAFVADPTVDPFTVSGTLTIPSEPVFTLRNLPDAECTVVVAQAAAFAGTANLLTATVDGLPATYSARVRVVNGQLVVRVYRSSGTILILW